MAAEENIPAVKPAKFTGIRKGPQAIQSVQDDIKMEVVSWWRGNLCGSLLLSIFLTGIIGKLH